MLIKLYSNIGVLHQVLHVARSVLDLPKALLASMLQGHFYCEASFGDDI